MSVVFFGEEDEGDTEVEDVEAVVDEGVDEGVVDEVAFTMVLFCFCWFCKNKKTKRWNIERKELVI